MNQDQVKELLQRYRMGLSTPEEEAAIGQWYETMAASGEWNWTEEEKNLFEQQLYAGIRRAMHEPLADIEPAIVRKGFFGWTRVAAAAAILLCLVGGIWFFSQHRSHNASTDTGRQFASDILPGSNKAILTLADGSDIILDSVRSNMRLQQGNTTITRPANGRLAYQLGGGTAIVNGRSSAINGGNSTSNGGGVSNQTGSAPVNYNRLTTPRGGQYQLVLPDGTRVWLNSASSIKYPTAFAGKERRVELRGEAYFEVEHGTAPFIVSIVAPPGMPGAGSEVQVLGTHFNINAYGDEAVVRTTLLEGAVKLIKGGNSLLLQPGQQAEYQQNGSPVLDKGADASEAIAWKNGIFLFNRAGIQSVMKQVERWYDVDVEYEGKIPEGHFSGTVDRNANISQILTILELSGVHFRIEGRRVVILPG